jgi:N-acetylglucosamine-6-sulfatase
MVWQVTRALRCIALLTSMILAAAACDGGPAPPPPTGSPGATGGRTTAPSMPADDRPNIVLVVTDDQRWDTLQVMPTVQMDIAGRGVAFSNAFAVNPICCPSRASILTGLYSHSTGVYTNSKKHGGFDSFEDSSTVATWLQDAGYQTALIGKYLNGYQSREGDYVPPGWDRWFALTGLKEGGGYFDYEVSDHGNVVSFGLDPGDYSTDVLADRAEAFVMTADTSRPLFLYLAPHAPHEPATPAPRHEGSFSGEEPRRPPGYDEEQVADKPAWIRELPGLDEAVRGEIDELRERQLASLQAVDEAVARLLEALEETGRLENTLVVFTSDNGLLWGEHRLTKKSAVYEESIRVPLVVRFDPLGELGRIEQQLVTNIDLAPTIAAVAELDAPEMEGRSLVPLLAGQEVAWRSDFLVEHVAGGRTDAPTYCAVRSDRHVYAYYATGEEELYDLRSDPHQLDNRAADPGMASLLEDMRHRLTELCNPTPPGLGGLP